MHYILLAVALNLGKENISVMKLDNIKKVSTISDLASNNTDSSAASFPDSVYTVNETLLSDEDFSQPYVGGNDFAELLPEDEFGNVIKEDEEQGPKFLDAIKNRLVKTVENQEPQVVVGSQVEGPAFFNNMKNLVVSENKEEHTVSLDNAVNRHSIKESDVIVSSEDSGPSFFENIKNRLFGTTKKEEDKAAEVVMPSIEQSNIVGESVNKPSILDTIKDKTSKVAEKITGKIEYLTIDYDSKDIGKEVNDEEEKVKIVGTLFDSELNNALKDENKIRSQEIADQRKYSEIGNLEYNEDEDYQKFLEDKEIKKLVEPEKIIVPNIVPKEKKIISYRNTDIPEELLASRSFQNRHIPKMMLNQDRVDILEKIIEYGMITEFRAFMNDLRDANLTLSSQYTLLTYATKYKQYEIMKYLIHIGADVNKRDDRLDTPVIVAVKNNDMEALKILTEANANLDTLDIIRRTPLIYCIEKGQEDMGVYLIDNGADVNITNGVGEGTLSMSMRLGRNVIKDRILRALRNNNEK